MKLTFWIIPALAATALLAQDPGGPPQGMGGMGPRGPMGMDGGGPGGPRGRMGMRDRGMRMRNRGMGGQGMGDGGAGLSRMLSDPAVRQQVGVTADQVAKIRQQESDFRKAEIRNRADLEIKRMDLQDLLAAEKPDRAAIDSKLSEVGAAQLAMEKAAVNNRLDMRAALTPAQRLKLQQVMAQRRQPMPAANAAPRVPQGAGRGRGGAPAPPGQPRTNE